MDEKKNLLLHIGRNSLWFVIVAILTPAFQSFDLKLSKLFTEMLVELMFVCVVVACITYLATAVKYSNVARKKAKPNEDEYARKLNERKELEGWITDYERRIAITAIKQGKRNPKKSMSETH